MPGPPCKRAQKITGTNDFRVQKLNPNFFLSTLFGHPGISCQESRDIPPKGLVSLGFVRHAERFGPHTFASKTPTPPEDIRTKKFGFGFLFLA